MDVVKQSAALCLLRLFRTSQEIIPGGEWTSRIVHLLNDQHLGVVTAAASLIDALVKRNPDEYKGCISLAVSRLSRVISQLFHLTVLVDLFFTELAEWDLQLASSSSISHCLIYIATKLLKELLIKIRPYPTNNMSLIKESYLLKRC